VPVVQAIDDVADMAVHYIGSIEAPHVIGPAALGGKRDGP
jgi:hypothetical protein